MSWLSLTIIAQFLNSIVALFDKYLVTSKRVTTPVLYVFYTGFLTCLGILVYVPGLLLPVAGLPQFSGIGLPSLAALGLIMAASLSQLVGLWALFSGLKKNDASDVVPVVGSLSAVFSLLAGYFFGSLVLPTTFAIGFALLVLGTLFISHLRFSLRIFWMTVIGGLGFALHSLLLKQALLATGFDTGFFWFSISSTILSLGLLAAPGLRKSLRMQKGERHAKSTGIVLLSNKMLAGIAGILLIKAIEVGEVSIVQALGGLQFVFLFLLASVFGPITPIDFGENITRKELYQKLFSICVIFLGFVLLFV